LTHIEINPWIGLWDTFRAWLIVKQGCTNLSDANYAEFVAAGKLGLVSVASGGGAGGEINTASNEGLSGVGLWLAKTGVNLEFKNIRAASAKISVANNGTEKTVDVDLGTVTTADVGDSTDKRYCTDAEKTKLTGIAAGAEVNVNADWTSGSGDSQILNKPSTFAPTDHAGDHVTGGGDIIANAIAAGNAGLMTGTDKTKLDGIASGAEVNVNADWASGSGDSQILNKPATYAPSSHDNTAHSTAYLVATAFVGFAKISVAVSAPGSPGAGDLWVDLP